mgnify:CR=1 FL=1
MALKSAPLFVLPLLAVATTSASAADLAEAPPPEFSPLTYISIEGGPVWSNSSLNEPNRDKFGDIDDANGFYAAATLRRMFNPSWDWQITGTGTWFSTLDAKGEFSEAHSDLDFQTVDLDLGYHVNGNPLTRLLFGARLLHSNDSLDYIYGDGGFNFDYSYEAEGWAIGPRVGLQSETMLGGSQFGFVAEGSGSVLFGSFDVDRHDWDSGGSSSSQSRTVYNLEGLAGLSWHPSTNVAFTIGYRAQQWWNLREGAGINADGYRLEADEDVLVHGPFLRAAVNF